MCTVLLPPSDNPIAVNKYINIYSQYCAFKRGSSEINGETLVDLLYE